MQKTVVALFLLLGTSAMAAEIPVVGMNENGKEVVIHVSRSKFAEGVAQMIESTQEDALPALSAAKTGKKWMLRTLALGIGLDIKLGFTPVFELGIAPRFRAILSNSTNAVIP